MYQCGHHSDLITDKLFLHTVITTLMFITDKIQHYMLDEYGSDCAGHHVIKSVHVQCFYEGKPQDETR